MTIRNPGTENFSGSAKIYTFPPRGRYALQARHEQTVGRPDLPKGTKLVAGGAWYHDDAIEAEQERKN